MSVSSHFLSPSFDQTAGSTEKDAADEVLNKKRSSSVQKKIASRKATSKVEQAVEEQFGAGRIIARLASRPGQSGRADGYILEGKELEFYMKKLRASKHK